MPTGESDHEILQVELGEECAEFGAENHKEERNNSKAWHKGLLDVWGDVNWTA